MDGAWVAILWFLAKAFGFLIAFLIVFFIVKGIVGNICDGVRYANGKPVPRSEEQVKKDAETRKNGHKMFDENGNFIDDRY